MNKSFPKFSLTHHLYISWDGFASDDDRTKRCNNMTAGHSFLSHQTDEWNIVFWLSSLYGVISTLFCWIYKFQQFIQKYRTISKKSLSCLPLPFSHSRPLFPEQAALASFLCVFQSYSTQSVSFICIHTHETDKSTHIHTYLSVRLHKTERPLSWLNKYMLLFLIKESGGGQSRSDSIVMTINVPATLHLLTVKLNVALAFLFIVSQSQVDCLTCTLTSVFQKSRSSRKKEGKLCLY